MALADQRTVPRGRWRRAQRAAALRAHAQLRRDAGYDFLPAYRIGAGQVPNPRSAVDEHVEIQKNGVRKQRRCDFPKAWQTKRLAARELEDPANKRVVGRIGLQQRSSAADESATARLQAMQQPEIISRFCYPQLTGAYPEADGLLYAYRRQKTPLPRIAAATRPPEVLSSPGEPDDVGKWGRLSPGTRRDSSSP